MVAKERRLYSREFKLAALARFETTGNVQGLALELGVSRELFIQVAAEVCGGRCDGTEHHGPAPAC